MRKTDGFLQELNATGEQIVPSPDAMKPTVCACPERLFPTIRPAYAELLRRLDLPGESLDVVARDLTLTKITSPSGSIGRAKLSALRWKPPAASAPNQAVSTAPANDPLPVSNLCPPLLPNCRMCQDVVAFRHGWRMETDFKPLATPMAFSVDARRAIGPYPSRGRPSPWLTRPFTWRNSPRGFFPGPDLRVFDS
jgi:hypothetical protein